jgi:hypothetical protein
MFELEHLEGRLTPSGLHVTGQPTSLFEAVNTGNSSSDTVHFSVAAAGGAGTQSVQWEMFSAQAKTFVPITDSAAFSGTTTDTLTVVVPSTVGTEQFLALFTNTLNNKATGTAKTHIANLTTGNPPGTPSTINSNPPHDTVTAGQKITFMTSDTGTDLSVQWQVNRNDGKGFVDIPDAKKDSYTFHAKNIDNGYEYQAVFSNLFGPSQTAGPVTLTVDPVPVITTQPKSQLAAINTAVTLSVAVKDSPASDTYQWFTVSDKTLTPIQSATSATYKFTPTADGKTVYVVQVTNSAGTTITSKRATVTVLTPPTKQTDPTTPTTVAAKAKATFTAVVTGSGPMEVEWKVEKAGTNTFVMLAGENVTGAAVFTKSNPDGTTTSTLTFKARTGENGDVFEAIFTNALGDAFAYTTAGATLDVTA